MGQGVIIRYLGKWSARCNGYSRQSLHVGRLSRDQERLAPPCHSSHCIALHCTRIAAGTTVSASVSQSFSQSVISRSACLSICLSCCSRFGFLDQEFLASRIPCQASTVFCHRRPLHAYIFRVAGGQAGRRAGYGSGSTPQRGNPRTPLSISPDHTVSVLQHHGTKSPALPTRTVPAVPHPHALRCPFKLASLEPWKLPSLQVWSFSRPRSPLRGSTHLGPA